MDADEPGIGKQIARAARSYGLDILNALFLTPLPGTRLWDRMQSEDRIAVHDFPNDWKYYTLGFPTAQYKHFSWADIVDEMNSCDRSFYSLWQIARRVAGNLLLRRQPIFALITNLSYRNNARLSRRSYDHMDGFASCLGLEGSEK